MDEEQYKQRFLLKATELLKDYPEFLERYRNLLETGGDRLAYSFLQRTISEKQIPINEKYDRADEDYYWLFIA